MATPGLQNDSRRRLPRAPSVDVNLRSGVLTKRGSFEMEQRQTVKKRLTPEVVAMLLSLDYSIETVANVNKVSESGISTTYGSEMKQSSNTKVFLQGNIGSVNILKTSGQPLGFSLREYNANRGEDPGGIFVSRLTPGGVVEKNSLLSTGDEILEINGVAVKDYKLSDVVAMIQIPKKLILKVSFRHGTESTEICREIVNEKLKPIVRNINNNRIYSEAKRSTALKQDTPISTQGNTVNETVPAPGILKIKHNSSGRILPTRPESDLSSPLYCTPCESHASPHASNAVESRPKQNYDTKLNGAQLISSNNSGESNNTRRQRTSQTGTNMNPSSGYENVASKHKSQKRSTVIPASIHEIKYSPVKQWKDCQDGRWASKRLDPGDIEFDIINKDEPVKTTSCALDEIKIEPKETSKSGEMSEICDSSSSLSGSDSPKYQSKKSKSSLSNLSRSELLAHSSRLSDGSPVSSSAESEDQISKLYETENQKPPLLHSLSSEDLNQSNNSWFSKISHQKRKPVRKFSEGPPLRPLSKSGEPYRVQESTETSDAEHGYRLYPGSSHEPLSRAVTGMLTLDIVKGAQIESPELKEKRKKTKVFCSVDFDGVRQACTTPKKGLNDFQWNDSFEIELQRTREIRITVCARLKKEDVKVAEGCLSLSQLLDEGNEHLLAICLEPSGMLCVKLKFTDMKFLLQRTPSQKKEGCFGVPLEAILRRENSDIPNLVRKCVTEINDRGLEVIGLYRICGNAAKKKVLRAQFENNSVNVDLSHNENPVDVNIITGLLKDYLRELPHPLISHDVRELLGEKEYENVPDNLVTQIIKKFPSPRKATIMFLLDHFVAVLLNSDVNKMDSHNLAVCIGPVLLCPSLGGTTTVSDTKKDINAIKMLLEIWPKPEQVSAC